MIVLNLNNTINAIYRYIHEKLSDVGQIYNLLKNVLEARIS